MKTRGDQMIVLNFHGIGDPARADRTLEPGENGVWISVARFGQILDGLGTLGSMDQIELTFDDGNTSDVEIALPMLVERNLTATFFLISDRIDTPGTVSRNDMLALTDAGMRIGVHGKAHRAWATLNQTDLEHDINAGKTTLEEITSSTIEVAACPFGSYNRRVLRTLRSLGYTSAYTSDAAINTPKAWQRARYTIHTDDTIESIRTTTQHSMSLVRSLRDRARIMVKSLR